MTTSRGPHSHTSPQNYFPAGGKHIKGYAKKAEQARREWAHKMIGECK